MTTKTPAQLAPFMLIIGLVLAVVVGELVTGLYVRPLLVIAGAMVTWATLTIGTKSLAWIRREVLGE